MTTGRRDVRQPLAHGWEVKRFTIVDLEPATADVGPFHLGCFGELDVGPVRALSPFIGVYVAVDIPGAPITGMTLQPYLNLSVCRAQANVQRIEIVRGGSPPPGVGQLRDLGCYFQVAAAPGLSLGVEVDHAGDPAGTWNVWVGWAEIASAAVIYAQPATGMQPIPMNLLPDFRRR